MRCATVLLLLAALTACGDGAVRIDWPQPSGADRTACRALVEDLPDTLAGEPRRSVSPDGASGAAWGDPAYVLSCGVDRPEEYEATAECSEIAGVGWFVPAEEMSDPSAQLEATAMSHSPYVRLRVPPLYRTDGLDAALAELAPLIEQHLEPGKSCL